MEKKDKKESVKKQIGLTEEEKRGSMNYIKNRWLMVVK